VLRGHALPDFVAPDRASPLGGITEFWSNHGQPGRYAQDGLSTTLVRSPLMGSDSD
jgi:hypothetical protein